MSSPHFLSLSLSKCLSIFTIFIPFCLVITSKLRYMFLARLVRKRILELVCFPSECCYYIPARLPEGIYKVTTQTNCFLCPNSQTITTFFLYIISIQSIFWNPKLIAICAASLYRSLPRPEKTTTKRTICVKLKIFISSDNCVPEDPEWLPVW